MQSAVHDTYISMQTRLVYFAFIGLSVLSIIVMALESYALVVDRPLLDQFIIVASIFLGIMYSMVSMLVVEVVYQDEIDQFPLIHYLARLTPELSRAQRVNFLSLISKRQITSTVSMMVAWIIIGGTHRATALVFAMTIITMFTLYGIYYVESMPPLVSPQSKE